MRVSTARIEAARTRCRYLIRDATDSTLRYDMGFMLEVLDDYQAMEERLDGVIDLLHGMTCPIPGSCTGECLVCRLKNALEVKP